MPPTRAPDVLASYGEATAGLAGIRTADRFRDPGRCRCVAAAFGRAPSLSPFWSGAGCFQPGLTAVRGTEPKFPASFVRGDAAYRPARGAFDRRPCQSKILPEKLPPDIFAIDQAPHGALFARAAVIVHHCGIGTLARALRAGRPQFGVPFVFDQPDNSTRLSMLGVARAVHGTRYTIARATEAISHLLAEPAFEIRASKIAAAVAAERGLDKACAAVEEVLDASRYVTLRPGPPLQASQPA